jgi:protein required for attachment to host cells
MNHTCIAVVDASRARLFTLERVAEPTGLRETLEERRDLVNPARRLRPNDLFSDSRPGSSRAGSLQFNFDDHRDAHVDGLDAEFARAVATELAELLRTTRATRLILCASPRMLGELRSRAELRPAGVAVDEIPRDLVKLTPTELRDQLGSYGMLPPRESLRREA